jgi:hypothetical protein
LKSSFFSRDVEPGRMVDLDLVAGGVELCRMGIWIRRLVSRE